VSVIDIGTGSSCIYALLGATMNGWNFVCSVKIIPVDQQRFILCIFNIT